MAPTLLIANIGNRNLLYKGATHIAMAHAGKANSDFRTFTEQLHLNFEAERDHLRINILDSLLSIHADRIDHVILFSSDHPEGDRRDQDTVFAGHILTKLIPEAFPGLTVENRVLSAPVTDNNRLLRNYREELYRIRRQYPDARFLICDAGGTAQQKSSLKIIFEYLFDRADFQVYYVSQGAGYQSEVRNIPPIEYRRIIDAEQISSLIACGQYAAAEQVFARQHRDAPKNPVFPLLRFCRFRQERLWLEAQKYADLSQFPDWVHPQLSSLTDYRKLRPIGTYEGWAPEVFSARAFFELCEAFAITERYYQLGNYTQVVINLFRLIESYLYHALDENLGYHFNRNFPDAQHKLIRDGQSRYPNLARFYKRGKRPRGGVPMLILAAENISAPSSPTHQAFIECFKSINSFLNPEFHSETDCLALDTLRHQIAHRGLGVTAMEFQSIPGIDRLIEDWHEWLQMPAVNPYLRLNDTLNLML